MRRPSWRDPRLGVGILLVVASVALGSWVVARADATVTVYQAAQALTPGEPVDVEDLRPVQIRLDGVEETYLVPGADLGDDAVAVRTVEVGELVPLSAIGLATEVTVRPIQIAMSAGLQDTVRAGSRVDVWVALPDTTGGPGAMLPPELLVEGVEVRDVHEDTSVFAGADAVQLQVLVEEADVPTVLAAIASEGEILVVPQLGGDG